MSFRQNFRPLSAAFAALLLCTACSGGGGDDGGGIGLSERGEIEIDPGETNVAVDIGLSGIGETQEYVVTIRNVGNGPLNIDSVA
ncbi:MAG: hypothetical protein ACI9WU_004264, partial [Myxococcota bacterium]